MRATCPAHLIRLDLICLMTSGGEYKLWTYSLRNFLHSPVILSLLGPKFFSETYSQTLSVYALPLAWETTFHAHTKQLANFISLFIFISKFTCPFSPVTLPISFRKMYTSTLFYITVSKCLKKLRIWFPIDYWNVAASFKVSTAREERVKVVLAVNVVLTVGLCKDRACEVWGRMGWPRSAHPCQENFACDKSPSCGVISSLKTKKTAQELVQKMW
jgi:hypothetical protein